MANETDTLNVGETSADVAGLGDAPAPLEEGRAQDEAAFDPVNDYSGAPKEIEISEEDLGRTFGSTTGEEENAIAPGGWQGTDDATSTAPSDLGFDIPEPRRVHAIGEDPEAEDPTGRAYAGGLDPDDGGVVDITGKPVEESRDWDANPVELNEG